MDQSQPSLESSANTAGSPAGTGGIVIVPLRDDLVVGMVSCHREILPDEAVILLGPKVTGLHHRFYANDPRGICLAAVHSAGAVCGIAIGGGLELRRRFVRRYGLRIALHWTAGLLIHRALRKRLGIAVRRLYRHAVPGSRTGGSGTLPKTGDDCGTLLWIGIRPAYQGRGIGSALLREFERRATEKGFAQVVLSVHVGNDSAIHLYRKQGWQLVTTADGLEYYLKQLVAAEGAGGPEGAPSCETTERRAHAGSGDNRLMPNPLNQSHQRGTPDLTRNVGLSSNAPSFSESS